jgi:hypothetical protein
LEDLLLVAYDELSRRYVLADELSQDVLLELIMLFGIVVLDDNDFIVLHVEVLGFVVECGTPVPVVDELVLLHQGLELLVQLFIDGGSSY